MLVTTSPPLFRDSVQFNLFSVPRLSAIPAIADLHGNVRVQSLIEAKFGYNEQINSQRGNPNSVSINNFNLLHRPRNHYR